MKKIFRKPKLIERLKRVKKLRNGLQREVDLVKIQCPFCFEFISMPVDRGGGEHQTLVYDCAVCCRPILVTVDINDEGGFYASVERES